MSQLFDYFQRCYIVNLPERSDRRHEMEGELRQIGLTVDADHIRYFRAIRPENAGEFPSLGARGCFMSHLGILQQALADNLENILILEDDLSFAKNLDQLSLQALNDTPWHFAYFGHVADMHSAGPVHLQTTQLPLATTHFYALSREVMRPLHDHLQACLSRPSGHPLGSPMHVDGAYSLFRQQHPEYTTLISNPSLGHQRSSRSDIYPNQWFDRLSLSRVVVAWLRGMKNGIRA